MAGEVAGRQSLNSSSVDAAKPGALVYGDHARGRYGTVNISPGNGMVWFIRYQDSSLFASIPSILQNSVLMVTLFCLLKI